jgi:hypothetical protein
MGNMMTLRQAAAACGAILMLAAPGAAQLANPSTAALGMGENYTAAARGVAALAWNPAGLALTGGPGTSALAGTVRVISGLGPVTLADLASFQGEVVPENVRRQWVSQIAREGGQTGAAGFDLAWASLQFGSFALQFSTSGRALNNIGPGFAELLLIGNVDETGGPRPIELHGSSLDMHLYSTAAGGFAVPIAVGPGSRLAVGVTGKYTFGHSMALSGESAGEATTDPLAIRMQLPVVYTPFVSDNTVNQYQTGGGFGLDIGVGFETGPLTLAAVAKNIVSTFEWDRDVLRYRATALDARLGSIESSFERQPLSAAPASIREQLDEYRFHPNFALGAQYRPDNRLTVAGDLRFGGTDGLATNPPVHAGAGLQYRLLPWLPVQLGAAMIQLREEREGLQFTGGLGIELGSFQLSGSAGRRNVGGGGETMIMVTLLSHAF